jgi:hypothetical protein
MNPARKKRAKARTRQKKSSPNTLGRLRDVLLRVLYGNCQKYSFFPVVLQYVLEHEWAELYSWAERVDAVAIGDAVEYFAAAQVSALVRKYPFDWRLLKLDMSPEDRAVETFKASEIRCKKVNRLFNRYNRTPYTFRLEYMRRWIRHVLGDAPNLLEVYQNADFGSGANLGVHGNATNLYRKVFAESWSVTRAALPYAVGALMHNENVVLHLYDERNGCVCFDKDALHERIIQRLRTVPYNKISFVPKTAKTHRGIAVEPLLNGFVQKGIDQVLRRKLKAHGYDLTDQSRNQFLAKLGSISGKYSTMDLSAASDSISVELARYLLPAEWFELLNRTRSACYELGGKTYLYEKFCSMGNGFCFPLETLFFAAAVRASLNYQGCDDRTHAVYGDDIIVPTDAFVPLKRLLALVGFEVNTRKSFNNGPFRESCGADWYRGQDVRPVYLDYPLVQSVDLRIFHNSTYRGSLAEAFFSEVRPYLRNQDSIRKQFLRPRGFATERPKSFHGLTWDEKRVLTYNLNGAYDVELDEFMASRCAKWDRQQFRWRWREVLYRPAPDTPLAGDSARFARAQYLALLRGSPEGRLALRRKTHVSIITR